MRGKTFTRIRIKSDEFRGVSTTKDEAISSPTSSPMSYNFTYEKGVLAGKYGISAATFPSDVTPRRSVTPSRRSPKESCR